MDHLEAAEQAHLESLTAAEAEGDERAVEAALRPRTLDEVVPGQPKPAVYPPFLRNRLEQVFVRPIVSALPRNVSMFRRPRRRWTRRLSVECL